MGKQFHIETRTMKFLVVLALVAAAYAEPEAEAKADPAYWYGNYWGTPSYYGGWGYSGYASPYWGGYYNRGYGYWKRDAEAKPEANADPAYWYGNYYGLPSYYGGWGYSGYASPYWGGYYNRGYGYWKSEAEANPEAYWYGNAYGAWGNRWGYSGWYNRPYGYNWGYSGYRRYGGYWW